MDMKRALLLGLLAGCLALSSCSGPGSGAGYSQVPVYVEETDWVTVVDNCQWVEPGEGASFRLIAEEDRLITDVDYSGDYALFEQNGTTILVVAGVRYPTRITLETEQIDPSGRYVRTVTYRPNGGEGEPFDRTDSIRVHTRPNTARGGFSRAGYTLTGWNTRADGSGTAVGLGSRVTVPEEGLTLYAQWMPWTDPGAFSCRDAGDGVTVTGYRGEGDVLVVPGELKGKPVTAIASGAFRACGAQRVILPPGLAAVEEGAFENCALRELTLFDDIRDIGDGAFAGCEALQTLHINAATAPYGYSYRRESLLADKVDMLIDSRDEKKLVFYGGCSVWYNLIGSEAVRMFGSKYRIINMGINGSMNSLVQMEIIGNYLGEGDIFLHTPELSSAHQLLTYTDMYDGDEKLWCGLEYNYDLFALVDIRGMRGVFDSLAGYLSRKKPGGSYGDMYRDVAGGSFMDYTGSISALRTQSQGELYDEVFLNPESLAGGLPVLEEQYGRYIRRGARVYVSYACVDIDGVPEDQRGNVELLDGLFRQTIGAMDGPVLISTLSDYLFHSWDCFDTHYHLLTQAAYENTAFWLRDLRAQMERDGVWP